MSSKDSLFMQHKNMELCHLCEYSVYDAVNEKGWNCNNRNSKHFTRKWDLDITIMVCDVFQFATASCKRWVESEFKKAEAKKQTTLGDF